MNWIKNKKKFNISVWIGLALLLAAISIWLVSIIELKSNEIMLTQKNLPIEEVWRYNGALNWWKAAYNTAIIPTTAILVLFGMLSITGQHLFSRLTQDPLNNFEVTLQQACKIDTD